jgi:hypothetical protein
MIDPKILEEIKQNVHRLVELDRPMLDELIAEANELKMGQRRITSSKKFGLFCKMR